MWAYVQVYGHVHIARFGDKLKFIRAIYVLCIIQLHTRNH